MSDWNEEVWRGRICGWEMDEIGLVEAEDVLDRRRRYEEWKSRRGERLKKKKQDVSAVRTIQYSLPPIWKRTQREEKLEKKVDKASLGNREKKYRYRQGSSPSPQFSFQLSGRKYDPEPVSQDRSVDFKTKTITLISPRFLRTNKRQDVLRNVLSQLHPKLH